MPYKGEGEGEVVTVSSTQIDAWEKQGLAYRHVLYAPPPNGVGLYLTDYKGLLTAHSDSSIAALISQKEIFWKKDNHKSISLTIPEIVKERAMEEWRKRFKKDADLSRFKPFSNARKAHRISWREM